ncbi:hypothetical protein CsSME_00010609 [Camellia sinensis var. sinensis]
MGCEEEILIEQVCEIYERISKLESLKPSKDVNMLFTQLVLTCMPPSPIDLTKLSNKRVQETRSKLIKLCGEAEGLLETHFSTLLGTFENPLDHLNIFPYLSNYLKLSLLEFTILTQHYTPQEPPKRIAFPLITSLQPLSTIMTLTLWLIQWLHALFRPILTCLNECFSTHPM